MTTSRRCFGKGPPKPAGDIQTQWLVGGFKHVLFSIIYGIILPIDYFFFKMVKTTNQMKSIPPWQSCKTFQMIRIWPWPPNGSIRSVMTFNQSEFTYDFNWPCRSFNSLAGCELTFSNTIGTSHWSIWTSIDSQPSFSLPPAHWPTREPVRDSGLIMWTPLKKTACSTVKGDWVRESCHNMPFHVHNITVASGSKHILSDIISICWLVIIGSFN